MAKDNQPTVILNLFQDIHGLELFLLMRNEQQYYVYIISNKWRTTFYIGVTNDIHRRMQEHRERKTKGFSQKYFLNELVYLESGDSISAAIAREKQLKNWHREWKLNLIRSTNPLMEDLAKDWAGGDAELNSA